MVASVAGGDLEVAAEDVVVSAVAAGVVVAEAVDGK